MVFRDAELEYDTFELLQGQIHEIKVTQRSKVWMINSMEAYFFTLEVNMTF